LLGVNHVTKTLHLKPHGISPRSKNCIEPKQREAHHQNTPKKSRTTEEEGEEETHSSLPKEDNLVLISPDSLLVAIAGGLSHGTAGMDTC
jgi:hypothetical protein